MASSSGTQTSTEYIVHHLTNLSVGEGFWTIHLDTMIVSGLLGLVAFLGMLFVARKATSHTPSRMQNFIEMVFTMVNDQVKDTFHAKSNLVTPLAITIFVWVFLMNAMDLIPVDFLPNILLLFGVEYFKQVPTTDPNLTFAMSISVFFIMIAMN